MIHRDRIRFVLSGSIGLEPVLRSNFHDFVDEQAAVPEFNELLYRCAPPRAAALRGVMLGGHRRARGRARARRRTRERKHPKA